MNSVIGQILPLAVAVALSTVPVIAAILIVLSPAKPLVGLALLIGWTAGVAAIVTVFTIGFQLIPSSARSRDDTVVGVVRILLGVALIAVSIAKWRRRNHERTVDTPKWMRALGRINALGAFGFGFVLALRPKNLILSLAAAIVIGDASLTVTDGLIVIGIFTLIGISTVAVPIVAHLSAPEKTQGPLGAVRDWIVANNVTMILVVVILTGVVIIGSGIAKL